MGRGRTRGRCRRRADRDKGGREFIRARSTVHIWAVDKVTFLSLVGRQKSLDSALFQCTLSLIIDIVNFIGSFSYFNVFRRRGLMLRCAALDLEWTEAVNRRTVLFRLCPLV